MAHADNLPMGCGIQIGKHSRFVSFASQIWSIPGVLGGGIWSSCVGVRVSCGYVWVCWGRYCWSDVSCVTSNLHCRNTPILKLHFTLMDTWSFDKLLSILAIVILLLDHIGCLRVCLFSFVHIGSGYNSRWFGIVIFLVKEKYVLNVWFQAYLIASRRFLPVEEQIAFRPLGISEFNLELVFVIKRTLHSWLPSIVTTAL